MRKRSEAKRPPLLSTTFSLQEVLDYYEYFSERASTILRQLGFAGLGIVWIFKVDRGGNQFVPRPFVWPSLLLVVGLGLDLLHYLAGAAIWGGMFWKHDTPRGNGRKDLIVNVSSKLNIATELLFCLKALVIAGAYGLLIAYLSSRLG